MRRAILGGVITASVLYLSPFANAQIFSETFDGPTTAPQRFESENWDIAIFTRDRQSWYAPKPGILADHGDNCEGPPVQHAPEQLEDLVYRCNDHLMTAMNDDALGRVTLTPNQVIDFTYEYGVIEFDLSTFRRGGYDWIEIFITPFEDNLIHPAQPFWDSAGPPRNGIALELVPGGINRFNVTVFKDGVAIPYTACGADCPGDHTWIEYDTPLLPLIPSQRRRDTFRITLDKNEISFGVFGYYDGEDNDNNFLWLDKAPLPDLNWSRGVVQFTHASFDPMNNCQNVPTPQNPPDNPPGFELVCDGDTWHWDNIRIQPSEPFRIIQSAKQRPDDPYKQRFVDPGITPGNRIGFVDAAPANAFLRFSAIGSNIQLSFDNGATWATASLQPQLEFLSSRFNNYFHPMPEGADSVQLRGDPWWGGAWHARDFSVWVKPSGQLALPSR